jgi:hypothetical protein
LKNFRNLSWGKTSFKLLGINFDVDLDKIVNINYNERILQIKKLIKIWSKRNLTVIGKITESFAYQSNSSKASFRDFSLPSKINDVSSANCDNLCSILAFKLLGINFDVDLDKIVNINYNERILQIKKLFKIWSKRNLTVIGKITVVKTRILPVL